MQHYNKPVEITKGKCVPKNKAGVNDRPSFDHVNKCIQENSKECLRNSLRKKLESKVESEIKSKVESKVETKEESKVESEVESKVESVEENICSNKNCSNKGALMCSRCKKQYYCSSECQKLDWSNHRTECKAQKAQKAQKAKDEEFGMYFKNDFKGLRPVISTFMCFNIKENESFMFYLNTSQYGAFISEIFMWAYNNKIDVFYDENIVLFGFTFAEKLDGNFEEFCMTSEKALYAHQCYKDNLKKGNDIDEINVVMKRPLNENISGWSYTKYDHIIRDNNKVVLDMIKSNGKKWTRLIIINSMLYKFIYDILKKKKTDSIMFCDSEIIDIRKPSSFEKDYLSMLIDLEKKFSQEYL